MKFCSNCGAAVTRKIPPGDSLPRDVCDACGTIHYTNPRMIVGCVPVWEDKVLLCKRAIEPRRGLWTVPAGFMENGETLDKGAARETLEEANARVEIGALYAVYNIPHVNQVYLLFLAKLLDLDFHRTQHPHALFQRPRAQPLRFSSGHDRAPTSQIKN
jgi:ADP-ribose pyrophosphatase YjhB (NUDIX family)